MKGLLLLIPLLVLAGCAQSAVTLRYDPIQCEPTPWQEWAAANLQFTTEPHERDMFIPYAAEELDITVEDILEIERNGTVCMACGCPEPYYHLVIVGSEDADALLENGWTRAEL